MLPGTYSIVALDPATGELGAAVQSHWFAVGAGVIWVRPGIGAVATQALHELRHGPEILDRLALSGGGAKEVLAEQMATDDNARFRQVGVVDASGEVSAHTGGSCITYANHVLGDGFSCQANLMGPATVPEVMAEAFASSRGELADRLLATLLAAEKEGGDIRGRQSSAMLVAPANGKPWEASINIRADDDDQPLVELERLLRLQQAYNNASKAEDLIAKKQHAAGAELFQRALELAPESEELTFWVGLAKAQAGETDRGVLMVKSVIAKNKNWMELLERLSEEIAPGAEKVRDAIRRSGVGG